MTQHIHYLLIEEWARTGKQVQHSGINNRYHNCIDNKPEWNYGTIYRFKPEVIKYKRYIYIDSTKKVGLYNYSSASNELSVQNHFMFVKWIDKEWQEYEI